MVLALQIASADIDWTSPRRDEGVRLYSWLIVSGDAIPRERLWRWDAKYSDQ